MQVRTRFGFATITGSTTEMASMLLEAGLLEDKPYFVLVYLLMMHS